MNPSINYLCFIDFMTPRTINSPFADDGIGYRLGTYDFNSRSSEEGQRNPMGREGTSITIPAGIVELTNLSKSIW